MAAELSAKYRIPMPIARDWLGKDYLVPLLDGLDEVQTALQPECVAAINEFIENNKPSGLVVCCRLREYQWLPERLRLNGAICLEPLRFQDVNKFLTAGGPQLAGLEQALSRDPVLRELAQTPLMLSIMSLACEGADGEVLTRHIDDSPKARREHIFYLYIERMFERKGLSTSSFSKDQTINWLSWLARKMREQSQSVLMVERLQPSWLSSTGQRWVYEIVTALSVGWLIGWFTGDVFICLSIGLGILFGCRTVSPWENGIRSGLASGFVVGLGTGLYSGSLKAGLGTGLLFALFIGLIGGLGVGSLKEICLVETMRWQWKQFWGKTVSASIKGLIVGLVAGSIAALVGNENLLFVLWCSGAFGMIGGLTGGLVGGLSDSVKRDKMIPNQGIRLSYINSMVALLICLLSSMLLAIPLFFPLMAVSMATLGGQPILSAFGFGLPLFMIFEFALSVGLNRGGSAVVKHYALRIILWLTGATPFRFIPFLDHCAKLILLKKVGGGYIFIHRTLLEYFAALPPQNNTVKKVLPDSAS